MQNKPSWLFWAVAVLAILWNGFGVFDYWMTSTGNEKYLQEFDPKMIEWIENFPMWRDALWLTSVAAGVLGAVALVLRKRIASTLFLINFVTILAGFVGHDILMASGIEMYGVLGLTMSMVIVGLSGLFWWYANRAAARGALS